MFDDGVEEKPRELAGVVEGVRHHNPEDGWTVARLRVTEGAGGIVTAVGNLAEAREGMEVKLWGQWVTHPQWGEQFRFIRYQLEQPLTVEAIKRFLSSGAIKGVGPATAAQLVARFGEEYLEYKFQTSFMLPRRRRPYGSNGAVLRR